MAQIRVLTLNKDQFDESVLYRLEKDQILKFVLGPSLMGHDVHLFTNYPKSEEEEVSVFDRSKWRELPWQTNSRHKNDDLDKWAEIFCEIAGPFGYYYTCDDDTQHCGSGFFQIAPTLHIGHENVELPLDCIQCQTMLSKCLGPFEEWEARLRVTHESGFNMIHLTPVQTLGQSESCYSLKDQHEFNTLFSPGDKKYNFDDLKKLTSKMKDEWGVLTISDVVYNHTSDDSPWLREHPECAYNLKNSPHLRPAFLLCRILTQFGREVAQNQYENKELPALITNEDHLNAMRSILRDETLPPYKFSEFFQLNVEHIKSEFIQKLDHYHPGNYEENLLEKKNLEILQDREYSRLNSTIDFDLALRLFAREGRQDSEIRQQCIDDFTKALQDLNCKAAVWCSETLRQAVEALVGHVRYQRVNPDGLKIRDYNNHHPLFTPYFTTGKLSETALISDFESAMYNDDLNAHFKAYNGWVLNDNPLVSFAEYPSMVYFQRSLICWGDSVKLRYGQKPDDCPFLWKFMREYTRLTAECFHGFRIDNCHSTPIHVAQYFLDYARTIRPELYICAELFTGHEKIDNLFVNKLGITSLIREAQVAPTVYEESRLIYRYGGVPVGAFIQKNERPLTPSIAHAIFMDLTHDNQCPIKTRTVYDLLPTAALVSSACCAVGSNRGYDELVPFHVDVVHESRLYTKWTDNARPLDGEVNLSSGIIAARRAVNELHWQLGAEGYNEIYVDKMTDDVIAVTRHNPKTRQSVVIVASTCFSPQRISADRAIYPKPLHIAGSVDEILLEAKMVPLVGADPQGRPEPVPNEKFITGVKDYRLDIKTHIKLFNSKMIEVVTDEKVEVVEFKRFATGSVVALKVSMFSESRAAIRDLRQYLNEFGYRLRSHSIDGAQAREKLSAGGTNFGAIMSKMSLQDLNRVLFRSHDEEADEGKGGGAFYVQNIGNFVYCGLAGMAPHFKFVRLHNDMGHPLCGNVRDNDWLLKYVANRLTQHPGTADLGNWFNSLYKSYAKLPHYLKPCFLEAVISGAYSGVCESLAHKLSGYVQTGSTFVRHLALGSLVFAGYCRSALLPHLAQEIDEPHPPSFYNEALNKEQQACTTIAAGLPHFATGLFRNWGRDTFIALPGILLIPGRYDEARYIILAFAGCLRHGLIPNLLGGGEAPRYNCRDAVWWWLHAVKLYCRMAPLGTKILQDKVLRLYPNDESVFGQESKVQCLHETMQEALNRHFEGIEFRERNAGRAIDEHMRPEGFDLKIGVDPETGFVFGGNQYNCGTWMDKMGSSDKATNRGRPATPRDGSAVELVGLCYAVLEFLDKEHREGMYPYSGVTKFKENISWTWRQWMEKIGQNFERYFWISEDENFGFDPDITDPKKIVQHGIYKDSFKATVEWGDYQFRPNFVIALAVAPEMVNLDNAQKALEKADLRLKGPLGMKTLGESDYQYNGYYNNADDSHDAHIAQGFNYHNGPEWVWIMGYFLMAKLRIARLLDSKKPDLLKRTISEVKQTLSHHYVHISKSDWKSLPELTNRNGEHCHGSCPAQAWSVGCILEVMYDMCRDE